MTYLSSSTPRGQFDLSNPQHLAMRKLMADIYIHHCRAECDASRNRYKGMAHGLSSVSLHVLKDLVLFELCFELVEALGALQDIRAMRAAA